MKAKLEFTGTGGELFVKLLVGYLLSAITLGIYMPWFMVKLQKYMYEKTSLKGTGRGDLTFQFNATGGQLFVLLLVGYLLCIITIGIYTPWFMAKWIRFFADNSVARAADGTTYRMRFDATGGELFVTLLVGYLLSMITFGIYAPWFSCKLEKLLSQRTALLQGETQIGSCDFLGAGGQLFVTMLVGYLLTMITLGIYGMWFQVKLIKWFANNMRYIIGQARYTSDFTGTGGQLFVKVLVGYLLTLITLGIYGAWFMAELIHYHADNTFFVPEGSVATE